MYGVLFFYAYICALENKNIKMKQILTLLLVSSIFIVHAQTEKEWVLGVNLGYKHQENGTLPFSLNNPMYLSNYRTNVSNETNNGFQLGRKLNENIVLGFGINSFISKIEVNYGNAYKGKGIGPVFYLDYIKSITNKLAIVLKGYIQYDFCKYEVDNSAGYGYGSYGGYGYGYSSINMTEKYKYQYLNTGLRPSFRFDLNERFGLELIMGKIEYRKRVNDQNYQTKYDNASLFQINMNPQEWLIGCYLNF